MNYDQIEDKPSRMDRVKDWLIDHHALPIIMGLHCLVLIFLIILECRDLRKGKKKQQQVLTSTSKF
jgi:hypothetical protein